MRKRLSAKTERKLEVVCFTAVVLVCSVKSLLVGLTLGTVLLAMDQYWLAIKPFLPTRHG